MRRSSAARYWSDRHIGTIVAGWSVFAAVVMGGWTSTAMAETVEFGGALSSTVGVFILTCDDACEFLDYQNRNILDLELDADLGPSVDARAAATLRNDTFPDVGRAEDSAKVENLQDVSMRFTDAWVAGYDVGVDGLDIRVGAQTERWGTGDGYSPSDRLNPYDLSDATQFDQRLAVPAAHASFYTSSLTFSATWFPFFMPSMLSERVVDIAAGSEVADDVDLDDNVEGATPEIENVRTRVELPPQTLSESAVALRAQRAGSIADVAVGWYYGRDTLPQLSGEVIPENFFDGETTDLVVNLRYPKLQMVAAEARAPLFGSWTGWIDAALMIPSQTTVFISQSRLEDLERLNAIDEAPDEDISAEIQAGNPYPSFLVGADTSIGTSVYLNFQYIHGFIFERNASDLHHYGLVGLRAPAIDSSFEVELSGGVEANQQFDAFGFLSQLGLNYRHDDVLELGLGAMFQSGQDGTTLGLFSELSEVRVRAAAHF